jgi:MinD-like ATPase involved in chromosome partitioning or flagellar assembly
VFVCWSPKGGVGTTTVAAGLALALAGRSGGSGVLLVDLAGDLPGLFGLDRPGPGVAGWLAAGSAVRADALTRLEREGVPGVAVIGRGDGPLDEPRLDALAAALHADPRPVVVDIGRLVGAAPLRTLALAADESVLIVRACPSAVGALRSLAVPATGVVVVRDPGRRLSTAVISEAAGAPVVAEVALDPAVGRAVDADLSNRSLPRGFLRVLGRLA